MEDKQKRDVDYKAVSTILIVVGLLGLISLVFWPEIVIAQVFEVTLIRFFSVAILLIIAFVTGISLLKKGK